MRARRRAGPDDDTRRDPAQAVGGESRSSREVGVRCGGSPGARRATDRCPTARPTRGEATTAVHRRPRLPARVRPVPRPKASRRASSHVPPARARPSRELAVRGAAPTQVAAQIVTARLRALGAPGDAPAPSADDDPAVRTARQGTGSTVPVIVPVIVLIVTSGATGQHVVDVPGAPDGRTALANALGTHPDVMSPAERATVPRHGSADRAAGEVTDQPVAPRHPDSDAVSRSVSEHRTIATVRRAWSGRAWLGSGARRPRPTAGRPETRRSSDPAAPGRCPPAVCWDALA